MSGARADVHALDRASLRGLAEAPPGPRVSLQIPLEAYPRAVQNGVRARRAAEIAGRRLDEHSMPVATRVRMQELLDAVEPVAEATARLPSTLVAVIDTARLHLATVRSPLFPRVSVGSAYALRSLLRAWARESAYRVIAVSANHVSVLEGDAFGLLHVPAPGLPTSLVDALGEERTGKELRMRGTAAGGGRPVYCSHGGASVERRIDRDRFHHRLGHALTRAYGRDARPCVLVADLTHQTGLRGTLRIEGLLPEGVHASPDSLSPADLHTRAWPLVEMALRMREREALAGLEHARGLRRASDDVSEVAAAAAGGRVRRLFVEERVFLPGRVDRASGCILPPVGDDDVYEHVVSLVLASGGEVHVTECDELASTTGMSAELHHRALHAGYRRASDTGRSGEPPARVG